MTVVGCREVRVQRLNQEEPSQLGRFSRAMANAGINIEVLNSDHDNQLIVAVDDPAAAQAISAAWI